MRRADYHLHSRFSADSEEEPRAYVVEAIEHGLSEICFTDHQDFNYPGTPYVLDVASYQTAIGELREEFSGRISIKWGLELGLDRDHIAEITAFAATAPFDFIVGSVHVIRGTEFFDPADFFKGLNKTEAYRAYFEEVAAVVREFDCFDALAHLNYVARYSPYDDKAIDFPLYESLFDEILATLVIKGKALEVNANRFSLAPMRDFYRCLLERFFRLGGRRVTLGTDSHRAAHDWPAFETAGHLIAAAGFTDLATYERRTAVSTSI